MKRNIQDLGVLERWWAIKVAWWRAMLYCTFHPRCRVYVENSWRENRGQKNLYGESIYDEYITFVAVVKGNWSQKTLKIVKEYYGAPALPWEEV